MDSNRGDLALVLAHERKLVETFDVLRQARVNDCSRERRTYVTRPLRSSAKLPWPNAAPISCWLTLLA